MLRAMVMYLVSFFALATRKLQLDFELIAINTLLIPLLTPFFLNHDFPF